MAFPRAYGQYNNSKIMTASPAELTLMLYEGAIKFCNIAIVAIEKKDVEKAHLNIQKTEHIIDYLRQTLDMKYPVAEDFERVYSYLSQRLIEANIKKEKEILEEVNGHMRTMRDTWKEVMRISKEQVHDGKLSDSFGGKPSAKAAGDGRNPEIQSAPAGDFPG